MTDLLVSLLGGVAAIGIVFILLYRFTRLGGKGVAFVMALLVIGIYFPIVILNWPGADVVAIHIAIYLVSVYVLGIIASQRDAKRLSGETHGWFHWGPAVLVVFFALVIGVDSILVFLAQKGVDSNIASWLLPAPRAGGQISSHFPGVVARDFGKNHDEFNRYQERMDAQRERHWLVQKGWIGVAHSGEPAQFKLRVTDKTGTPITHARVEGVFMRPGNSKLDQPFHMQEQVDEAGSYMATLVLPEPGKWHLLLMFHSGDILHEIKSTTNIEAGS